jgi:plasmid stabilization system protein ParE
MRIIWSPAALRQVGRIYDYLVELHPYAAKRVVDALILAGDGLVHFPQRGRVVPNTAFRELPTVHPYIIRYRVDGIWW